MSVDELVATSNPEKRELLVAGVQRLLTSGRCVWPPHEVTKLLVSAHRRNPQGFDWRQVDIQTALYERAIIRRDFTEELCLAESVDSLGGVQP